LNQLIDYLNCGSVIKRLHDTADFVVTKNSDISNIPFLHKYPLQGTKALEFQDLCKVVDLMKNKAHLTTDGLVQIKKTIKDGMNTGRISIE
jgi:hypothetical protein